MSAAADALLDRCLTVLQRTGFSRLSLREIAAAVGTSHRMLIYHFGSREGLLAQIVARIEADTRALLVGLLPPDTEDPQVVAVAREFWNRITAPDMLPAQRLFFEIYVQALYGGPFSAAFRAAVIDAWEGPLTAMFARAGVADPAAHARLGLAVTRGLGLDLLLTGERDRVEAALACYGAMVAGELAG